MNDQPIDSHTVGYPSESETRTKHFEQRLPFLAMKLGGREERRGPAPGGGRPAAGG
jgi:hypothetical protein